MFIELQSKGTGKIKPATGFDIQVRLRGGRRGQAAAAYSPGQQRPGAAAACRSRPKAPALLCAWGGAWPQPPPAHLPTCHPGRPLQIFVIDGEAFRDDVQDTRQGITNALLRSDDVSRPGSPPATASLSARLLLAGRLAG